jgi:hypothetical protein
MVVAMQILTSLSSFPIVEELRLAGYKNVGDASLIPSSSAEPLNVVSLIEGLRLPGIGEGKLDSDRETAIGRIPVVSKSGIPLMPCRPTKARKLLRSGKAIKKWNRLSIFCLQLTFDPACPVRQPLAIGIDPGSNFEGFSVAGTKETVINIMSEAVTWVKHALEQRRHMRRVRRYRKTRRRKAKPNRGTDKKFLPPSTKARWDAKLRIVQQLCKLLPLQYAVVEDIQAVTKPHQRKWNRNFSPLEVGKHYFYDELQKLGLTVIIVSGAETKQLRELFGLKKNGNKSKPLFEAHSIDAWVLAAAVTGATYPTTRSLYYVVPLHFHRRQLHRLQCSKDGIRRHYGGTLSLGLKRGTLVHHKNHGVCYVGGTFKNRVSLHCIKTGKRLTQNAKQDDFTILTRLSFRTQFLSP